LCFDLVTNLRLKMRIGTVEKDGSGIAQEIPRPHRDNYAANDTHDGIEPNPAKIAAGKQRHDRQHRGQRIRQHMYEGGAQVVIVVMHAMTVTIIMVAVVMMIVTA